MAFKVVESGWSLVASPLLIAEVTGLNAATDAGVEALARDFLREWRLMLARRGGGRWYTEELRTIKQKGGGSRIISVGSRVPHRASAPKEPPALDTGASLASLKMRREKYAEYVVWTDKKSLLFLEYGVGGAGLFGPHPAGIIIEPRPHARPALQAVLPRATENVIIAAQSEIAANALVIRTRALGVNIRKFLISVSSDLGWLASLGVSGPALQAVRKMGIRTQRGIGDLTALSEQKLGARLVRRAAGRVAGRSIGATARGLARNDAFSQRVIRRMAGAQYNKIQRRMYVR
jgi:hypothetical protein